MTSLRHKFRKAQEYGIRKSAGLLLRAVSRQIYAKDRYFLLSRSTAPAPGPPTPSRRRAEIDAPLVKALHGKIPFVPRVFWKRLSQGASGFVFFDERDEPLGYFWCIWEEPYFEPFYNWTFRLGKGEAYAFDAYARPSIRGSRLVVTGYQNLFSVLRERGIGRVTVAVRANYRFSLKLHLHLGFAIESCIEVRSLLRRFVRAREIDYRAQLTPEIEDWMRQFRRGAVAASPEEAPARASSANL